MITTNCINGEISRGDLVVSTADNDYSCLVGKVIDVVKAGSPKHETRNPGDDVYVDFMVFEYSEARKESIERSLSKVYGQSVKLDDIALDNVIMAPESLVRITGIAQGKLAVLLDDEREVAAICYQALVESEPVKEYFAAIAEERKRQVSQAEPLPTITDIAVRTVDGKRSLLGFADVTLNNAVTIRDVRIMQSEKGIFVAMPSKPDATSRSGYRNIVVIETGFKEAFNSAVIDAYFDVLEETKDKASGVDQQMPPKVTLAEQIVAVKEKTAPHNPSRATTSREGREK